MRLCVNAHVLVCVRARTRASKPSRYMYPPPHVYVSSSSYVFILLFYHPSPHKPSCIHTQCLSFVRSNTNTWALSSCPQTDTVHSIDSKGGGGYLYSRRQTRCIPLTPKEEEDTCIRADRQTRCIPLTSKEEEDTCIRTGGHGAFL